MNESEMHLGEERLDRLAGYTLYHQGGCFFWGFAYFHPLSAYEQNNQM